MARTAISGGLTRRLTWRPANLKKGRPETAKARSLTFEVPGWPGHVAGQHVDVRLTADDGYTAQRSYSLSAPARGDSVTITVQQVDDGEVSPYLVGELAEGQAVEVRGPVGGWFVWHETDTAPILLVGGGSGIVPLMAMIRSRRAAGSKVPFRLIYSVRTPADVLFADELRIPRVGDGGLDTALLYTRELPAGYAGVARRISPADLAAHGWPADLEPTSYVCGPNGFVEAVAQALVDQGHRPDRVRTERFGPGGA